MAMTKLESLRSRLSAHPVPGPEDLFSKDFNAWIARRTSARRNELMLGAPLTAEELAGALGGQRKAGDQWVARCPAHNDARPSLWIKNANGKILLKCHAGCEQWEVIGALADLGLW